MKRLVGPPRHRVIQGHVITELGRLRPRSIRLVVTSPPYYGLRGYGTEPQAWGGNPLCRHEWALSPLPGKRSRWGDVSTLSKKQSSNRGSRSNVEALERDGGRHCLHCAAWLGELGQEPTLELYIEHLCMVFDGVWDVLRDDGLVFLNLGDNYSYDSRSLNVKPKDLYLTPWRTAIELQERGWYVRNTIIWEKPNAMPRSVKDSFTSSYEPVLMLAKSRNYYFDFEAVMEDSLHPHLTGLSWQERKSMGASKRRGDPRDTGHKDMHKGTLSKDPTKRRKRDVWRIPTKGYTENKIHFASFPSELVEPCILAGSAEGDLVLDPFGGTGTVAEVAKRFNRRSISIELNAEYADLARRRNQIV